MDPEKVQELLESKQREMAFQMDQYYRQRMATMMHDIKRDHAVELERCMKERDDALRQLEISRSTWEKDRTSLHDEAERGYQDLYSTIQSKHGSVIETLKNELTQANQENTELKTRCELILFVLSIFFVQHVCLCVEWLKRVSVV